MSEFNIIVSEESDFEKDSIISTYNFASLKSEVTEVTKMMASEQTTGTWIKVPGELDEIKDVSTTNCWRD